MRSRASPSLGLRNDMTTKAAKKNPSGQVVPPSPPARNEETDFATAMLTLAGNARAAKSAAVKPPAGEHPAAGRTPLGSMPVAMGSIGAAAWDVEPTQPEDFVESLHKQLQTLEAGDMSNVEAMLYTQAVTLQSMFVRLSTDAMTRSTLSEQQQILALAFKAQAQCRQTLETLGNVKFPRATTFVRQANIANGPQQVNNHAKGNSTSTTDERSVNGRARGDSKLESEQIELSATQGK